MQPKHQHGVNSHFLFLMIAQRLSDLHSSTLVFRSAPLQERFAISTKESEHFWLATMRGWTAMAGGRRQVQQMDREKEKQNEQIVKVLSLKSGSWCDSLKMMMNLHSILSEVLTRFGTLFLVPEWRGGRRGVNNDTQKGGRERRPFFIRNFTGFDLDNITSTDHTP